MGYIGQKRSVRSQQAIDRGLLIYSQLTAWQKRAVDENAVWPVEWHHTGKFYQHTNYYNPKDFEQLNPKDFPLVKEEPHSQDDKNKWYVLVSAEWGGTKRHPKIVGTDVKVVNKITKTQKNANKYFRYGGYIKEFDNKENAEEFARTAQLEDD